MYLWVFWLVIQLQICYINAHITYIAIRLPLQGNRSEPGSPWPQPETMHTSSSLMTLDPLKFTITSNMVNCDVVDNAISRYLKIIRIDKNAKIDKRLPEVTNLNLEVDNLKCPEYPNLQMNESYILEISEKGASLKAQFVWGILRGLETFSQLLYVDSKGTILINQTYIEDKPRFPHRGLMLDTARHFIPVWLLLKNLDAMAYNKMNVFHWHIVDDQSFPYQSKRFPDLSAKGAYSPQHVYSPADVKRVIEYARLRGIRVIPEFDTPGHTQSWGKSIPDFLTPCWEDGHPGVVKYNVHGAYEIVNPMVNTTFQFLKELFTEVVEVFPDKFVHLGMDESYPACWKSNPDITSFMDRLGLAKGDYSALEEYYIEKVLKIVESLNQNYIIWQDPIDHSVNVNKNAIIEVWKGDNGTWKSLMANITSRGHKVILSSCWYLNYISYGQDWRKYYQCDPLDFPGSSADFERVLGGEVCMWAEYVDQTNLISRLWPRASAAAERLWSSNSVIQDTDSAAFRLDQQRCRMVKRGIAAEPILDGYCGDYELLETNYYNTDDKEDKTSSSARIETLHSRFMICIMAVYYVLLIN